MPTKWCIMNVSNNRGKTVKGFFLRPFKVRSDIVSVSKIIFNVEIMQFEGLQKRKKIIFLFIIRSVTIFVMHRTH